MKGLNSVGGHTRYKQLESSGESNESTDGTNDSLSESDPLPFFSVGSGIEQVYFAPMWEESNTEAGIEKAE